VHYAHKLVQTRRSLERSPHLQTNQERSAGLSARNPPNPHWPPFFFSGVGAFLPKWPLFLNWCEELFAASVLFLFLSFSYIVCKPSLGHPILTTGQRSGQSFTSADGAQKDFDGQGHFPSMVLLIAHSMRKCGLEPLQFNWLQAAVRPYNA